MLFRTVSMASVLIIRCIGVVLRRWVTCWASILCLLVLAGQLIVSCITNWLSRVLGNGQAFLHLMGPEAVTMRNGRGSVWSMFLMAIRCLVTVLRSVDRAPGVAWPTLLVRNRLANIGLG